MYATKMLTLLLLLLLLLLVVVVVVLRPTQPPNLTGMGNEYRPDSRLSWCSAAGE